MTDASYRFLPWVRGGVAAALPPAGPASTSRLAAAVALTVTHDAASTAVSMPLTLYGPGDVTGIDPRQVIRTDPPPSTTTFEPNYFVAIELDAPELPWLFSPGRPPRAQDNDRLQPWICLVVVRREVASIDTAATPLPVLTLSDATGELPDLTEAWAWAHAQVTGGTEDVGTLLGQPAQNLSRLLCPRRLEPLTAYSACLVPTFAAGVAAGLGAAPVATADPAWPTNPTGTLRLPVYYSWDFSTGPEGDFESFVRRLRPAELGPRVGLRYADFTSAAGDVGAPGTVGVLDLEGALLSPVAAPTAWPDAQRQAFAAKLRPRIGSGVDATHQRLAPPVYGGGPAGHPGALPPDGTGPQWLTDLNLDPRARAAAGFGVRVVQSEREQLVASAWEQAAEVERANQVIAHAQLGLLGARTVFASRLARLQPTSLLQVTTPTHARIPTSARVTFRETIAASAYPDTAASVAFRRVTRPGGPTDRVRGEGAPAQLVEDLAAGRAAIQRTHTPAGLVSVDDVSRAVGAPAAGITYGAGASAAVAGSLGWKLIGDYYDGATSLVVRRSAFLTAAMIAGNPRDEGGPISNDPRDTGEIGETLPGRINRLIAMRFRFRAVAKEHQARLQVGVAPPPPPPPSPPLPDATVSGLVSAAGGTPAPLDPDATHVARLVAQVPDADGTMRRLLPAPSFPQPMAHPLAELSRDLLLPGLADVPHDTVGLAVGNAGFIEAYMAGLNHELARQLLYRGYVTDPAATFFTQFWDPRGGEAAAGDVPPLDGWTKPLGQNATSVGAGGVIVLLLRSELTRRYPTLTVTMGKPDASGTVTSQLFPFFRGRLEPDVLYVGFALSESDARTGGWSFLLEEHPTATRFALDEPPIVNGQPRYGGTPATWDDVSWGNLATDATSYAAIRFASAQTSRLVHLRIGDAEWGFNGGHMARITAQDPVRAVVPASLLLPS